MGFLKNLVGGSSTNLANQANNNGHANGDSHANGHGPGHH